MKVVIRRNEDMLVRELDMDLVWNGEWPWTELFDCDCNRHLFFQRAAGVDAIDEEFTCTTGAYSVKIFVDGIEMFSDFEG
jgi:hypothetical protein